MAQVESASKMEYLPNQLTSEREEKIVLEFIDARFQSSKRFDRAFKLDCLADWYFLRSLLPSGWSTRFFTNSFLPETARVSRAMLEQTMGSLFPRENFFDVWGDDGQGEVPIELIREDMKATLLKASYKTKVYTWGMETIDYGNGVICTHGEPFWDTRKQTNPITVPGLPQLGVIGYDSTEEKFINNRIVMKPVSRFDCFPFPGYYNDIQEMPYFIVREFLPMVVFKNRAKWERWKNVDKVQGWLFSQRYGRDNEDYETENLYTRLEATGYGVTGADFGMESVKFVELWHYYEAPPGGRGCRAYAVVADGKELLCCRSSKYDHAEKPMADLIWKRPIDLNMWQAQGVAREIRPYQERKNTYEAMFGDMMEYARNPMQVIGPNFGVKPLTRMKWRPGAIIGANGDIKDRSFLEYPKPESGLLTLADRSTADIEKMVHSDPRGWTGPGAGSDASNTTMGGKQIYMDQKAQVEAYARLFFEERGIAPQLQQVASLIQQFAPVDGKIINLRATNEVLKRAGRINGGRVQYFPHEVQGRFTVRAVGSVRSMESVERSKMMVDMFKDLAQFDPQTAREYSRKRIFTAAYEMALHRSPAEFELTDIERQEQAMIPPPLPQQMVPKFKDLKPYPSAAMAALQRAGLPSTDGGMTPSQELAAKTKSDMVANDAKQTARVIGDTIAAHAKPRQAPKVPTHLVKAFKG